VFSWLARAWNWATGHIDSTIASWVHDVVSAIYGFIHAVFADIIGAWNWFYSSTKDLWAGLGHFFDEVARAFIFLWRHWIPSLWKWIFVHLLKPLLDAWKWISHEGATLWHYITHPDLLAAYLYDHIIRRLEQLAWQTARKLGTFFLALIIHNLRQFLVLIEDIIHAVL
jgi:hypothetical protein